MPQLHKGRIGEAKGEFILSQGSSLALTSLEKKDEEETKHTYNTMQDKTKQGEIRRK